MLLYQKFIVGQLLLECLSSYPSRQRPKLITLGNLELQRLQEEPLDPQLQAFRDFSCNRSVCTMKCTIKVSVYCLISTGGSHTKMQSYHMPKACDSMCQICGISQLYICQYKKLIVQPKRGMRHSWQMFHQRQLGDDCLQVLFIIKGSLDHTCAALDDLCICIRTACGSSNAWPAFLKQVCGQRATA